MLNMSDKELAQYPTELAVTNPERLPLAMMDLVQRRLMLTIMGCFEEIITTHISQLEKQIRSVLDNEKKDTRN